MANLVKFINDARTDDVYGHSHVLLGAPYGKINVSNGRMKEFWKLYIENVHKIPLYLAERPMTEVPVLVDVDLKTRYDPSQDINQHIYTEKQVRKVILEYQTVLKEQILENSSQESLVCVLLEKKPYIIESTGTKYVKNGFHLHFPKCFISSNVQEAYIIPIVKKNLTGLFDNLYTIEGGNTNNHHLDFIDAASIKVHWLMYGSKKPNFHPYLATKCFAYGAIESDFETELGDYILPKLSGDEKNTSCKGHVMELLPRILSTKLHGRQEYFWKSKSSVITPFFDKFTNIKTIRRKYEQGAVNDVMVEVDNLMKLIKNADDRERWRNVGYCLWNITKGDEDGFTVWIEYSETSDKFDEAECLCLWSAMRPSNYTIGTLRYYAKIDSPLEYAILCKDKGKLLIEKAVEGGHSDLAKLLHNEYGEEFVYSTTNDKWYAFKNHIWKECRMTNYNLSERISDNNGVIISHLSEHIYRYAEKIKQLDQDDTDYEDNLKSTKKLITTLDKLIKQCKNNTFKASVMKECKEVFRDDKITDKLNTNPHLIAFSNGVYDFKNDKFRDGTPEDYLSKCLPIEYKDYGTVDNPEVMEVEYFFRKVLPDDSIRKYFLDQACQVFVGGNEDKVLLIWTGSGNNGKSVTQRLFEKMIGPLAVKVTTSLITGKKAKVGQAQPDLARTGNGVRWLVMDEPSEDEAITTGLLKSLTGNDSYFARDLYQGGESTKEIVPLYKMHMLCNKLPGIRNPDEAFWNRVRVIPFESKFVPSNECPESYEDQMDQKKFPDDTKFKDKLEQLLQPLAWYLISRWRNLNKTDRLVPEKVLVATGDYREINTEDPRQCFVEEYLIKDSSKSINSSDVANKYKSWFKGEYIGDKLPLKKIILSQLDKVMGIRTSDVWIGWTWKYTL